MNMEHVTDKFPLTLTIKITSATIVEKEKSKRLD